MIYVMVIVIKQCHNRGLLVLVKCCHLNRDFHSLYKVGRNGIIGIQGFNNSKNKSYLQWGLTRCKKLLLV